MARWIMLGLLVMLPWGPAAVAGDEVYDYNPSLCEAFEHNMDPSFDVPAGGKYEVTIDMRHCGGFIQNYQISLMSTKRRAPNATLMVLNQAGQSVGVSDPGHHVVYIGNVPVTAVYTVVVMSGARHSESCILSYTGAI